MFKFEIDSFNHIFIDLLNKDFTSDSALLVLIDSETPWECGFLEFNCDVFWSNISLSWLFEFLHGKNGSKSL